MSKWLKMVGIALLGTALGACNGSSSSGGGSGGGSPQPPDDGSQARVFVIEPGESATFDAVEAFISARPGDTIRFTCGFFAIDSTLLLTHTEAVTIEGCGMDGTVLSFRGSNGVEGILVNNARGIVIQDLTIADPSGNGLELRSVDHGTVRNVRAFWSSGGGAESPNPVSESNYQGENSPLQVACTDPPTRDPRAPENELLGDTTSPDYTPSEKAGRYGIYPVKSSNILIEGSEAIGASDAGIYVGQTSTAIIRDSRAVYNVFGFEIENVRHGEYDSNLAECNTGGFLVYDLDNLTQYGERTIMHDNVSRMNNTYNFAAGGFVSNVPPGSGMITLSYDRIDVFDNVFEDNNTGGIIHTSYELFPEGAGRPTDMKIDFYTEGMRVFNNTFRNNGNNLSLPTTNDLAAQDVARVLPALVGLKTAAGCALAPGECPLDGTVFRGAHIIWDGLLDAYDPDCPYPKDANGEDVPEEENFEGKPRHTDAHPNPACHYNAYKFHTDQPGNPRKVPLFFASCIDADNEFSDDSVTYSNFHGTRGLEAALLLLDDDPLGSLLDLDNLQSVINGVPQFPADLDMSPHDCEARYGENLEPIEPVTIPPFEPSGDFDPAPTPEEIAELCEADVAPGEVNFAAAPVNCPRLDQYHLFSDPEDPTSEPNGRGFPFVLNTKLFSDYAVKYRVAYLPPGTRITYAAPGADQPSGTLVFPTGTIIAKTFSFVEGGNEEHIETRLLIKRETSRGTVRWDGVPYIWETAGDGTRVARRQMSGRDGIAAEWDYQNVESGVHHTGGTANYAVPNANQCLSCHANNDLEAGSAPIGPKVRNLNRPYRSESPVVTDQGRHPIAGDNQIAWLCDNGLMAGCPGDLGVDPNTQVAANLERVPRFNVPGDAGHPAGSDADIEARTRAWLESNCQHCHNPRGFAANTGYYLDVFRQVDTSYGICKGPTATGAEGSGGRSVDVKPMDANGSILAYRIGPEADTPAARMPPISRSVVHTEAHALIRDWINNVVVADDDRYPGSESCAGG